MSVTPEQKRTYSCWLCRDLSRPSEAYHVKDYDPHEEVADGRLKVLREYSELSWLQFHGICGAVIRNARLDEDQFVSEVETLIESLGKGQDCTGRISMMSPMPALRE